MKIGLIIHSVTGNTRYVAEKLSKALADKGHAVDYKEVKTEGDAASGGKGIRFIEKPVVDECDVLIMGSHTEAFDLEPAMKQYLKGDLKMDCNKVICYATHQFPFPWLGGNRTVKKMQKLCREQGAMETFGVVIDWKPDKGRDERIKKAVDEILSLIGG